MDVIVMAGGKAGPKDSLYEATRGGYKSLLEIQGRPMAQWVLDAISASPSVGQVVITGLPGSDLLHCERPLAFIPDQGSILDNIQAGAAYLDKIHPQEEYCLVVAADLPALTAGMIEWLVQRVNEVDADLVYNVIRKEVMEQRFPNSRRTYIRLSDGQFCGGDANAVRKRAVSGQAALLPRQLIASRKNPVKQAAMIGFDTVFLLLIGQLSLDGAVRRICKRLGIQGRALNCPYAELGMDVDKLFQLEIMRADLEKQP